MAIPVATLARIGKSFLATVSPHGIAAQTLEETSKTLSKKSEEILGYNFVGLIIQLILLYAIGFAFAKFMEGVIFFRGGFVIIAGLFGVKIPNKDLFPQQLIDLFDGGISGFKYWDVVKTASVLLVVAEFIMYIQIQQESNKRLSPIAVGVFLIIGLALSLITFPELIQRLKTTMFAKEKLI